MSADENKAIVLRFAQVWGKGDYLNIIDELASPELRVCYPLWPASLEGPAAFKEVLQMIHGAFPDLELEVAEPIAEGDRVALSWTCRGTHEGDMMGFLPTGKRVAWGGITIYRIQDGKVVDETGEADELGLLRQIGAIPTPATA